jgi:hypothetical protein
VSGTLLGMTGSQIGAFARHSRAITGSDMVPLLELDPWDALLPMANGNHGRPDAHRGENPTDLTAGVTNGSS